MAASTSDDETIIRKRLLFDGDGGGDDRRISNLLKTFIKWCHSSGTDEECTATYQRMLSTLTQCEFSMEKTKMVYDMNLREMAKYEQIYKDIEKAISDAHHTISSSKSELQHAKRVRKNRQEYDALAKVIQKHPDRQKTLKKLEELDRHLSSLTEQKAALENKQRLGCDPGACCSYEGLLRVPQWIPPRSVSGFASEICAVVEDLPGQIASLAGWVDQMQGEQVASTAVAPCLASRKKHTSKRYSRSRDASSWDPPNPSPDLPIIFGKQVGHRLVVPRPSPQAADRGLAIRPPISQGTMQGRTFVLYPLSTMPARNPSVTEPAHHTMP
ncbi:uncharacterized protein LOC102807610 [Saccoglossus kowalevskii]|uniref:Uncharacterized protein LOC102807610 n=1 Tax=Saccoglossus kowalevskii TaxID=10224 RepID=A0ABM0M7J8_SACKO|nr:PREDICTED: uncharacterized protein LOC102807610 [Saccoglossus kowalevskii]